MKRKFYERVQQPFENAYLFGTQLRILSRQSHPELMPFQSENVIKDQFIKGLRDRSLRTRLQIDKDNKTLNEIVDEAMRYERAYADVNDLPSHAYSDREYSSYKTDKVTSINTRQNQYQPQQNNQQYQSNNQSYQQQNQNRQQQNQNRQQSQVYNSEEIRCYNCNKTGHYKRECPNKPKDALNNINSQPTDMHGIGKLNDIYVLFLVDTGAKHSCISDRVCDALGLTPSKISMGVCNPLGEEMKTHGRVTMKLEVNGSEVVFEALVIHNLYNEVILGLDTLKKFETSKAALNMLKKWTSKTYDGKRMEELLSKGTFGRQVDTISERLLKIPKDSPNQSRIILSSINSATFNDELIRQDVYSVNNINTEQTIISEETLERYRNQVNEQIEELSAKSYKDLTPTSRATHKIELYEKTPFNFKTRPVPFAKKEEFKKIVDEMLDAKLIRPSKSPYSSPVHLVKKADGGIRLTIDYRKLNKLTVRDAYPLPRIDVLLYSLKRAKIFSKFDLHSGYFQIVVEEESRKYTAFTCEFGHFEFNVMPMGQTNSGATFQRFMDDIFKELIGVCCWVYLDDIIVFSETVEDHINHLNKIFEILRNYGLKIKRQKCKFFQTSITFLGHVVENGTIKPSDEKIEAVTQHKKPEDVEQTLAFIGITSYYRKFVKDFARIAYPLHELCKKDVQFIWNDQCQDAFDTLKEKLIKEPILTLPDFSKRFY